MLWYGRNMYNSTTNWARGTYGWFQNLLCYALHTWLSYTGYTLLLPKLIGLNKHYIKKRLTLNSKTSPLFIPNWRYTIDCVCCTAVVEVAVVAICTTQGTWTVISRIFTKISTSLSTSPPLELRDTRERAHEKCLISRLNWNIIILNTTSLT